ncbi:response regulator transcription factor [Chloroflexi bacterium TSY]|nr:response regulator transcription factor [Chloroflexi bacterium TSY]
MNGHKILVVDDDELILQSMEAILEDEGADVVGAGNGEAALRLFYDFRPELVILDILMPGLDGWEICKQIRLLSDVPIIMLTGLDDSDDQVRGLNAGADDFIVKPFTEDILLARVRAALRRGALSTNGHSNTKNLLYQDDRLTIDLVQHQLFIDQQPVKLTPTEFKLLTFMIQNANHVLTYDQIIEHVWGWDGEEDVNHVQVHISHLRRKMETNPRTPKYLLTEHGVGYRFRWH